MYLHPRDDKGNLRFDPPGGGEIPSRFEQWRRYCLFRGVTDPRTVRARYEARYGKGPTADAGSAAG